MINIIKFKSLIFFYAILWSCFMAFPVFSQESSNTVISDDNVNDKKNDDTVKVEDLDKKSRIIDDTSGKKVDDVATKNNNDNKKQTNGEPDQKASRIEDVLLQQKPTTSLMFNDNDARNIERAIKAYKNKEKFVVNQDSDSKKKDKAGKKKDPIENERSFLHLSSLIYFDSDSWSVWIDSVKISSDSNKVDSDLYVKSISSEKVTIIWTMSISKWKILSGKVSESDAPKINKNDQVEVEFTLKQNQTYMLTTNKIIEGKIKVEAEKVNDKNNDNVPKS